METVRAMVIDPKNKETKVIELSAKPDYKEWKKLMGIDSPVDLVRLERFAGPDQEIVTGLIVDDEGLLKEKNYYFLPEDYHSPLAGTALLISWDDECENGTLVDLVLPSGGIRWAKDDFKMSPEFVFVDTTDQEKLN
jgi:hypothetical protein|tara:strand:- start:1197 stop:1607 length:411 start_codon:yes stop_codon:yes gene_type:complete